MNQGGHKKVGVPCAVSDKIAMERNVEEVSLDDIFGANLETLNLFLEDMKVGLGFSDLPSADAIRLIRKPYSRVYQVCLSCGASRHLVYIKIPRVTRDNRERVAARIETEFRIMKRLVETPAPPGTGVAPPLALYASVPALVTLGVEGPTLAHVYREALARIRPIGRLSRPSDIGPIITGCGQWLRSFHQATSCGYQTFDVDDLLGYLDVRLDALQATDSDRLPNAFFDEFRSRIAENAARVDPKKNLVAGRHNDFSSHNIITTNAGVRVIDFGMFDYGSVVYDVCSFWFELEFMRYDPSLSSRRIIALQKKFMESYGLIDVNSNVFSLAMARFMIIRLLLAIDRQAASGLSGIYWAWVARHCRSWLLRYASA